MPWREPSRPRPDCFTPPKGATSVEMRPVLIPTMPYSSASATRHTRDEVARRIQSLQAEHDALPEQIRLARDSYRGAQAIVAELELQEQLPAFIGVIARAAVTRHRAGFSREQGRYEIEIPLEALEAANTALDADLSAR